MSFNAGLIPGLNFSLILVVACVWISEGLPAPDYFLKRYWLRLEDAMNVHVYTQPG